MYKKFHLKIFFILFLIHHFYLVFRPSVVIESQAEELTPDNLIIQFSGAYYDENLRELINSVFKDAFQASAPLMYTILPAYEADKLKKEINDNTRLKILKTTIYPKAKNIIVEIFLRYKGDAHQWIKEGSYPQEALMLMDDAATTVTKIVKDFRNVYPKSKIVGFAICVGSEVLIRSIEKETKEFDMLYFFTPPIRDQSAFEKLLLQNGYDWHRVKVFIAEGDEIMPVQLKGGGEAFTLYTKIKD